MTPQVATVHHSNPQPTVKRTDKWLSRINQIIVSNCKNANFSNEELAQQLDISERQLFRIIKKLTGASPNKYIRHFRLTLAKELLIKGKCVSVKELGYKMGFSNISYFISQFDKKFGKKPLQILKENEWR